MHSCSSAAPASAGYSLAVCGVFYPARAGRRMWRRVCAACCCILVRLPSAATATAAAGNDHHGHHSPPPPSLLLKQTLAAVTLLPAPPASPHREHNGHDGHEGHKVHSEGRHEERPGHGGIEGQAVGDAPDDGGGADGSDVLQDPEEWSLLQELSAESTQPAFDGLTILLILVAFAGAFLYFMWLERGQAPPMYPMAMGVLGRATQKAVHARLPTS